MKNKLFLTLAATALAIAGCENEDLALKSGSQGNVVALLPTENVSTRTALIGNSVVWSQGDKFAMFATDNGMNGTIMKNVATLVNGAGQSEATFSLTLEGSNPKKLFAVYPNAESTTYSAGSGIKVVYLNEHNYVESKANDIKRAPMAAMIDQEHPDAPVAFKNAGAVLVVSVKNIPVGTSDITLVSSSEPISGPAKITFTNGIPEAKATGTKEQNKKVAMKFTATTGLTNKTFYFPLPVGTYTNLKLTRGTDTEVANFGGKTVERNARYFSEIVLDAETGSAPVIVETGEAANNALSSSNNVSVGLDEAATITLPATSQESVNAASTTLSFTSTPAGDNAVTVSAPGSGTTSPQVTIAASNEEGSANNFVINLPESTVTLEAMGESTVYNNVVASTAENTLKVSKGVTVKNLTVKKGNVRVSGKIENIVREVEGEAKTYIIVEDGAQIPAIDNENIIVMTAGEWDLREKLKENGKVSASWTLSQNVTMNETLVIPTSKSVTIDLNGYTLSAKDGALYQSAGQNYSKAVVAEAGSKVSIKNGVIGNGGVSYLFYGIYAIDDAEVNLQGVEFANNIYYTYNGQGKLNASDCVIRGWISGWSGHDANFTNCIFTIGKMYYPAVIGYGNTSFTGCKFFKNGVDADEYDDTGKCDSDGYYRCNYVVASGKNSITLAFTDCEFINEAGNVIGEVTVNDHPYHACKEWGDGKQEAQTITVNEENVVSLCSVADKETGSK